MLLSYSTNSASTLLLLTDNAFNNVMNNFPPIITLFVLFTLILDIFDFLWLSPYLYLNIRTFFGFSKPLCDYLTTFQYSVACSTKLNAKYLSLPSLLIPFTKISLPPLIK